MSEIGFTEETHSDTPLLALGAIVYGAGEGRKADQLITDLAHRLAAEGTRLAGAIQHNTPDEERRKGDMVLEDLRTGQTITISEDRGPGATGCRLDSRALEEIVGLVTTAIDEGAELLIINKFGQRECEGGGFRSAINKAVETGIPVLVGVNRESVAGWSGYAEGLDTHLALDLDSLLDWCHSTIRKTGKHT